MGAPLALSRPDLLREAALVGGLWLDATGTRVDVANPAQGGLVGRVPRTGVAEARTAIDAAVQAQPAWAARTAKERAAVLRRWHDLILQHREDLAQILTAEQGKPLAEARAEVTFGASFLEWFAEEGRRAYGETIPSPSADRHLLTIRRPVGVCAAITPWNFPNAMLARKVAPALAVGCAMVVKPAEQTPFSALALAVLAIEAGVPAGVLSVLTSDRSGAAEVGTEVATHPAVRLLSFTGSTAVGKLLARQSADTVKKLALELGGNAPFIVFDDADLDVALDALMLAKFRNAGQTCVSANRILLQAGIHDAFVERLAARIEALCVGDGREPGTDIGPLIDARAVQKVGVHVADALNQGATRRVGRDTHPRGGNFYSPTLLTGVTPAMRVFREETFGPVAAVGRFDTEAEAVALANSGEAGLAGYFFTRDLSRTLRLGNALDYGMLGINTAAISTPEAPFGGVKESGLGREGGHQGLDEYLESRYLCIA
ncbi:NAD-dependent succinate-semialdehyde dehydrogenase [Niveibacterium sp.]|uniref:NAD-dependent succinate-semialdehyde dehydrogenase n=1 Tax=Niveibacterium sp. TaxID=2017444 RepID=UPI0035AFC5BE